MLPSSRSQSAATTALAGGTCELFRVKFLREIPHWWILGRCPPPKDRVPTCTSRILEGRSGTQRVGGNSFAVPCPESVRKKERKQTTQGRDGRTARRHHTGILRRGVWCASRRPRHPWASASSYLSSQSLADSRCNLHSCHLAVIPLSSFFPLSLLLLSRRSPLPRSATPPPPAGPLFSLLHYI